MARLRLYIGIWTVVIVLVGITISPAASYTDFSQKIADTQVKFIEHTLELDTLQRAQARLFKRGAALKTLLEAHSGAITTLEKHLTIRTLQLADDSGDASVSDAKNHVLERLDKARADYEELLVLQHNHARSEAQMARLIASVESTLVNNQNAESVYQQLLVQARQEQRASQNTLRVFEERLDLSTLLGIDESDFIWPVEPNLGISAYFQDEAYAARFGFTHNAIDIPVLQGTGVEAAADGVVIAAENNGLGYNYISIAHSGGMLTTYGHVSDIFVDVDERVSAGDVIGLSGGTPGTNGAGNRTTGAHLHFEMSRDGLYINPLDFMPPIRP
jgi:murein DD-endopeptidase MepM/ murein hydrolase activator NlpD